MMDPDVLTQCIPACQVIEKTSPELFNAKVNVKFGFIPVKFNIRLMLSNLDQPRFYSMEARAEGGLAHNARATGDVTFTGFDDRSTRVDFVGMLMPGSKLFELGEPIIQKTAGKWFRLFFERFERAIVEKSNPA